MSVSPFESMKIETETPKKPKPCRCCCRTATCCAFIYGFVTGGLTIPLLLIGCILLALRPGPLPPEFDFGNNTDTSWNITYGDNPRSDAIFAISSLPSPSSTTGHQALGSRPGAELKLNPSGLDYLKDLGGRFIREAVEKFVKRDHVFDDVRIHQTRITDYSTPTFGLEVSPPSRITWTMQGGEIDIAGRVTYDSFFSISANLEGKLSGFSADLSATLASVNGVPQLLNVSVANVEVTGVSIRPENEVLETLSSFANGYVKRYIQTEIKKLVHKETQMLLTMIGGRSTSGPITKPYCEVPKLTDDLNRNLEKDYPRHLDLFQNLLLDMTLLKPRVEDNSLVAGIVGDVLTKNETQLKNFTSPEPIQKWNETSGRMVDLRVADFPFNRLLKRMHENGQLKFALSKTSRPKAQELLSPYCPGWKELCLGKLFPPLNKTGLSNSSGAEIFISASEAPKITFKDGFVRIEGKGWFEYNLLRNAPAANLTLLAANISLSANIALKLSHGKNCSPPACPLVLTGTVKNESATGFVYSSRVKGISSKSSHRFDSFLNAALLYGVAQLNDYLDAGVTIPRIGKTSFGNANMLFSNGILDLAFDLNYNG